MVPRSLLKAVRRLHSTSHSVGTLVHVLQELGADGDKQEEEKASSCSDRNEEAQSVGQLQAQHSLGSVLATAWQGKGCPSSTLALLSSGPSLRAGSMNRGGSSSPMGPEPSAWNLQPLGPGKVLSCPSNTGHIAPQMNLDPFPGHFPLLWRSGKDMGQREGEMVRAPPPHPEHPHLSGHTINTELPRDRPRQLSAQPSLGKSALNGKTWLCLR